ncbi:hypothetical protein Taro_015972, partial [Colocasia esculenta]|nr:hypothetical protein [Colocasia esculenta]
REVVVRKRAEGINTPPSHVESCSSDTAGEARVRKQNISCCAPTQATTTLLCHRPRRRARRFLDPEREDGGGDLMACNRLLASFFLFSLGCFHLAALPSAAAAEKVRLELFYETLCPYCSRFIVGFLSSIFDDGLISIIDLNLVPYGNARVDANGTITCQHGTYECLLNTVEACAISAWPDVKEHFNFIYCVEQLVLEHRYGEWESCFKKTGLAAKPVLDCYTDGSGQEWKQAQEGSRLIGRQQALYLGRQTSTDMLRVPEVNEVKLRLETCLVATSGNYSKEELELKYSAETDALQPPHRYVPWVVVNGRPLYDDYETFEAEVCKAYKGDLPKACEGLLPMNAPQSKAKKPDRVCYAKDLVSYPLLSSF